MSPLNEAQLHQIRDERKEQILGAALKVFAHRGIIGTKMSMIAAEAGISHGLLYHYFKSKDELFTALVEQAMVEAIAGMRAMVELPGTPLERIRQMTLLILDAENTPYFMLIHQARMAEEVPDPVKALIAEYSTQRYVDELLPLFREGQEAGQVVPGNLEALIAGYLAVLSGLMLLNVQVDEGYQLPAVEMLLRMVAIL